MDAALMYQTCTVHAPIPCKVMDQDHRLYMAHDRYLLPEGDDRATDQDQEDGAAE
jgi:hypothetical protein